MVAGRDGEEAVYIAKLYLIPDYSRIPIEPMALWFLQLLCSPNARFNVLAKTAHELDMWEPHAEIMCYRKCEEEQCIIEAEISELTRCMASLQEHLDNCKSCLEAGGVLFLLQNLKGWAVLPQGLRGQHTH